jgi:hypothetical protein
MSATAPAPPHGVHFRGAVEALFHSFPSGTPGGAQDLFASGTPLIAFDGGDDFGFELGATLRLRVFDDPPEQRAGDYGGVLRRADWDQTSDYGQLLRELRIGKPGGGFVLEAGPLSGVTLGHGHLVSRYSNRENPDYHPAGAQLALATGSVHTTLLASDVLGGRLFAGEVSGDLGRIFSADPARFDRFHGALSVAHDAGRVGPVTDPMTLMHLDFDAALYRGEVVRLFAYTGVGSRIFVPVADLGALVGFSLEGTPGAFQLGGKIEARKQAGSFRQGMFGPAYELQRIAGVGLDGLPQARELLPDGFSGFAEFSLASGPIDPDPSGASRVSFSVAAEHFSWGRTDADAALALRLMEGKAMGTARVSIVGVGVSPRMSATFEARYRFAPALYALAAGGTVYFPQAEGGLVRGLFGGVGVGADFER